MRRSLFWALLATCAVTGAVLWTERQAPAIVAALDRARPADPDQVLALATVPVPREGAALPLRLEPLVIEPVQRDPFVPVAPPMPKPPPAPPPPPPMMTMPPPPPVPSAPAVKARFLGRMVTPAGDRLVFLSSADKTWLARPGDALDEGYVVEAVTDQSVVLLYPELSVKVTLPLPPLPE